MNKREDTQVRSNTISEQEWNFRKLIAEQSLKESKELATVLKNIWN